MTIISMKNNERQATTFMSNMDNQGVFLLQVYATKLIKLIPPFFLSDAIVKPIN